MTHYGLYGSFEIIIQMKSGGQWSLGIPGDTCPEKDFRKDAASLEMCCK
jgi:hypothetical protein